MKFIGASSGGRRAYVPTLILLALGTGAAHGEVNEELHNAIYDVHAQSGKSLLAVLNEASPFREGGRILHGRTDWHISWRFRWTEGPNGMCRISQVTTKLAVTVTLPSSTDHALTDSSEFQRYVAALKRHELGHVEIARKAAAAIDAGILSLPQSNSCAAVEADANDYGHRELGSANQRDIEYDRDTDHGRTQGAWIGG